MCNNVEELKIINEKLILEIAELKPNEHKSEKKTNVMQILKNRENVNNDIQESETNIENGQIEDNQKINVCKTIELGLNVIFFLLQIWTLQKEIRNKRQSMLVLWKTTRMQIWKTM